MRPKILTAVVFVMVLSSLTCFAQQTYVSRFDMFSGYSFLNTNKLNLFENGYNQEFGVNVRSWLAIGGDFSVFAGNNTLLPSMLKTNLQQELGQMLPPGYNLTMPSHSTTYTFSAGPQINIRKLQAVTFFIRPALGGLHETATLKPGDPIATVVAQTLLGSSMQKSDTVLFYGFGGGIDFNASKHFGMRVAADFVHYNMFDNLLSGSENSVRFSVGPTFRFGENIIRK
jgi:hypothetical protein